MDTSESSLEVNTENEGKLRELMSKTIQIEVAPDQQCYWYVFCPFIQNSVVNLVIILFQNSSAAFATGGFITSALVSTSGNATHRRFNYLVLLYRL